MNAGMLWFDNDTRRRLEHKVATAADYYRRKYGRRPSMCFVHPSMMPAGSESPAAQKWMAGEVEVRPARWVLPNHYWIGEESSDEGGGGEAGA